MKSHEALKRAGIFGISLVMLFSFGLVIQAYAEGEAGAATVVNAANAFAFNPSAPFDVVELSPGTAIPSGYGVYLASATANVTIALANGTQVSLTTPGFFSVSGQPISPPANVQAAVTANATTAMGNKDAASALGSQQADPGKAAQNAGQEASQSKTTSPTQ